MDSNSTLNWLEVESRVEGKRDMKPFGTSDLAHWPKDMTLFGLAMPLSSR